MTQNSIYDRILGTRSAPAAIPPMAEPSLPPADEPPVNTRSRFMLASAGAAVMLAVLGLAFYQVPGLSKLLARNTEMQASAAEPAPSVGPFLVRMQDAGIKTCSGIFDTLGKALTDGSSFMVQTQWAKTDPDSQPLQAVVGMNFSTQGFSGPASGVVFASPVGSGCAGNMVRIAPFPQDCQAASALLPKGSTQAAVLSGIPVFNLPQNGGQAMLMPAGQGCIAVSVLQASGT
jgi:hypothetical protein